jgi:hypothetical protein
MEGRVRTLEDQGFNQVVVSLATEPEAHSDDDSDAEHSSYTIKAKEGRSIKVKNLFRLADITRRKVARRAKRARHK